jgi:Flp pilus assembly protein TadD
MSRNAPSPTWRFTALAALVLGCGLLLAYARTFAAPFVFDDIEAIARNPTIRHLWPLSHVFAPPHELGSTVGGRPLLNLTFALNFAISGQDVWSYHAANLAIHLGGALLLFGILRRAFQLGCVASSADGRRLDVLALAIAAVWALHPLQTEAVTYLSQRAESLASLFYLATLYAFQRAVMPQGRFVAEDRTSTDAPAPLRTTAADTPASGQALRATGWLAISAVACLAGVATKEIVATAPLIVLLFDRAFVSTTFRSALRQRWGYYAALALSWGLVTALVISTQNRGGTAGLGSGVSVTAYLLTQARAIVLYLRLAFWPHALVFDYGTELAQGLGEVWPQVALLIGLLLASVMLLVRRPRAGLAAAGFFILLAPSSSVVPVASQTIAEHRMYLPLAMVVALVAVTLEKWTGRVAAVLVLVCALVCTGLTWQRNERHRDDIALWSDTVAKKPQNARAQNNLGDALAAAGRIAEALPHYEAAVAIEPGYTDAHSNLGHILALLGRTEEAVRHAALAATAAPTSIDVLTNYGFALTRAGKLEESVVVFQRALRLSPTALDPRYDLGNSYYQLGRYEEAIAEYQKVLSQKPDRHDARFNLAYALLQLNQPKEALRQFEWLLRQSPNDERTHVEVANLLAHFGRTDEAIAHLETALRLKPEYDVAQRQLEQLRQRSPARTP